MSSKSCVFLCIGSDELRTVVDEFSSGKTVWKFARKYPKEKFLVGLFCSSERIFGFFVLLPGVAAVTVTPQAFYVTYVWDVWIIWKNCLCHLKSSKDESCTVQTVSPFFFSFLNMFSRKLAFRSGQECTTTLENLNCCFSPSLISGSLTVLVGSKKWKGSVRTNAVVFHDFN